MGTAGRAIAWHRAHPVPGAPAIASELIICFATLLLVLLPLAVVGIVVQRSSCAR